MDRETTSPLSHQITVGRAPVARHSRGRAGHDRNGKQPRANVFQAKNGCPNLARGCAWSAYRRGTQPDHQYSRGLPFGGSWPGRFQAQHAAACPRTQARCCTCTPPPPPPSADGHRGSQGGRQRARRWARRLWPVLCTRPCEAVTAARGPLAWDSGA